MSRTKAKILAAVGVLIAALVVLALTAVAGPIVGVISVILLGIVLAAGIRVEVRKHAETLIDAMMACVVAVLSLLFAVLAMSAQSIAIAAVAGAIAVAASIYAVWRTLRLVDAHHTQSVH